MHQLTRAVAIEAAPFGIRVNAICPAAMPYTGFMAAGGVAVPIGTAGRIAESVGANHPLGNAITAEDCAEAAVYPGVGCGRQHHRGGAARRRRVRRDELTRRPTLDRDRLRELFDLRSHFNVLMGGDYRDDPYPIWHHLRERGPGSPGSSMS